MRFRVALSLVVAAFAAVPATASASDVVARNATNVTLAVNRNNVALLNYRVGGRQHHTLAWGAINARMPNRSLRQILFKHTVAWGAINARLPTRSLRQISFKLDYSGGWGSRRKDLWRGFKNACGRYEGPALRYAVAACTARDGSHWVVQKWRRLLPPFGVRPTFAQRAMELHLSHWSGELPEFVVKVDWVYKRFDHLYGWLKYKGKGVYGYRATKDGSPLDTWGRTVMVDTYNSPYGRGWKRENGFLTHRGSGAFCYGFYEHGNRPVGKGSQYRATVMGPGVTPILFWQGNAPGPYDPELDELAFQEQLQLFTNAKCRHR